MRKFYLFLLSAIAFSAFSQNWTPINTTEKFCYSSDDTLEIINNVLWVDSVKSFNNQEVYYMNKIVKLIDEEENQYKYNEPQFLADSIIISEDGSWEFVDDFPIPDDGGFKLYPYEDVGFQWNFLSGITAEIESKDTLSIFGEPDSIKTIQLSNNQQIIISKEHGIINWRDEYILVGIEGRELGINVLKFEDLFSNISVGDVFCVESYNYVADEQVTGYTKKARITITEMAMFSDSIILELESFYKIDYEWGSTSSVENGYALYDEKYNRNEYTDAYPNTAVDLDFWTPDIQTIQKSGIYKFGGEKKTQIKYEGIWWNSNTFFECEHLYPNILCPENYVLYTIEHSAMFGFKEYTLSAFEYWEGSNIVGAIVGGDTIGTIYTGPVFLGTNQLTSNTNWLVYPNPAKEFITIQTPQEKSQADYKIYNINGILLKEGDLNQKESRISVNELPNGMYFIELSINGEKSTQKWIKN
jgi:hypothetical protein